MKRQSVANFLKGLSFSNAKSIGGNNTPAPIGKAEQICWMNFQANVILQIFGGFTWHYLFKMPISCANILAEL
jgi:hypothetical protein